MDNNNYNTEAEGRLADLAATLNRIPVAEVVVPLTAALEQIGIILEGQDDGAFQLATWNTKELHELRDSVERILWFFHPASGRGAIRSATVALARQTDGQVVN